MATGDVRWTDTVSHSTILADSLYLDGTIDYMHASRKGGKASLESVLEGDTLFWQQIHFVKQEKVVQLDSITFDTLKVLTADNRVEIYKSDLQAVTDSLIFNQKDSVFTLFNSLSGPIQHN